MKITLRDKVETLIRASGGKMTEQEALTLLGKTKADLILDTVNLSDIFGEKDL